MKRLFIFLFVQICLVVFSQENEVKYKGGEIYLVAQDSKTRSILFQKPYGKVLEITYDKFYKSYSIIFEMKEGMTSIAVNYLKNMNDGKGIIAQDASNPKDLYGVYDNLDYNGTMAMIYMERIDGNILSYKIVNATKD